MRKRVWILGGVLLIAANLRAASLDGTSWNVRVVPDAAARKAGENTFYDTLIFKEGKMTAKECVKYGFFASEYKMGPTSGTVSFEATQTSAEKGKDIWSGTVEKEKVQGKLIWTKPDGKSLAYTFKGSRK